MFRSAMLTLCLVLASTGVDAANKEEGRLENASVVLEEILGVPDSIPQELLDKAECVIVTAPHNDASEQVYGRRISAHTIVTGTGLSMPEAGRRFVDALEKNAPRNESQQATNEQ